MSADRCDGCAFYRTLPNTTGRPAERGECRRSPPVFHPSGSGTYGRWPIVEQQEWCGEFRPAPRKPGQRHGAPGPLS